MRAGSARSSAAARARSIRGRARSRSRRRDGPATREALLAAGADLFGERGYDGVPLWAIAKKARVNKAMISYHFGGKRELYVAILNGMFAEVVSRVERLADSSRPVAYLLRELIAVVAEVATRRHPHLCAMMLREVLGGGTHLDREVLGNLVRVLGAVRRIVDRGVAEGAFRPVDPLLTHLSLVGSLVFFFATTGFRERVLAHGPVPGPPPDAAAYVKHMQDLITHGLAARRGDRRMQRASRMPADGQMWKGGDVS
jgi:TetR/AcrR family transcriptional regulator